MASRVSLHIQEFESLLTNLLYKVTLVTYKMVGTEPIARLTFCVAIIFIVSCCHVGSTVEVSTVHILKPLYLSARDTADEAIWHSITETYVKREPSI